MLGNEFIIIYIESFTFIYSLLFYFYYLKAIKVLLVISLVVLKDFRFFVILYLDDFSIQVFIDCF